MAAPKLAPYVASLKKSKVFAPFLKEMTLNVFRKHPSNRVAREVVVKHLLALRWLNPRADIKLRQSRETGEATVTYTLLDGTTGGFEVAPDETPEGVVAHIMAVAADPDAPAPVSDAESGAAGGDGGLVDEAQHEARG